MVRFLSVFVLALSWCFCSIATAQFFDSARHLLPTSLQQSFANGECSNLMPRWPMSFFDNSSSVLSEESAPAVIAFSYFDNVGAVEKILVRYRIGGSSGRTQEIPDDLYEVSYPDGVVWLDANAEYTFGERHLVCLMADFDNAAVRQSQFTLTSHALLRGNGTYRVGVGNDFEDQVFSDGLTLPFQSSCLITNCYNEWRLNFVALSYELAGTTLRATFPDTYQENDELLIQRSQIVNGSNFFSFDVSQLHVSTPPLDDVVKGDVDLSGTVDFLDIAPFIAALDGDTYQAEADCDCDRDVDFADIPAFIAALFNR